MSEYVPKESTKVVIGVCGEQASGKTVFLTCIFQSIWTAVPDDLILDFERKEIGNASYFQGIEDSLLAQGPIQGTTDRSLYPARIFVRPVGRRQGTAGSVLSVDILDFAGRHFRSMADLKNLVEASESNPEENKALREVNDTLEQADAFVILINSREIDPLDDTPKRNPFSPSVNFMLSHCRAEHKPVALLFSQIDQTPRLTEELFQTLPRVREFKRKFTADLEEARQGDRPFGLVQRISCYETVPGDLAPRRQTLDGSIWRMEPAQVVLDLLRAALPRIDERLKRKAAEEERDRRERENRERLEAQARENEDKRRRNHRWTLGIAAAAGIVLLLGLLALTWYRRTENQQARLLNDIESNLREERIAAISAPAQTELVQILAANRADPEHTSTTVRSAIRRLEEALGVAARRLADAPALEAAYAAEIARLEDLVPRFDPAATLPWRPRLLPMLATRARFLSDWFGTARKERRERTVLLDASAKRFVGAGDPVFAGLLAARSTQEKEAEVAGWQVRIDADAEVASRIATIHSLLTAAVAERDLELLHLARKALVVQLVTTLLKRHENDLLREKLLTPLDPALAKLADGEVRFEVLAGDLLACEDAEKCASRCETVRSVIEEATTNAESWSASVDNLLRSLVLDLPPQDRLEVWEALADALSSGYLFSARDDAWPEGLFPLAQSFRPAADTAPPSTEELIERLAKHPIYERELEYLIDHLALATARRKVVPMYAALLSAVGEPEGSLQIDGLVSVGREVTAWNAERPSAASELAQMDHEIGQILELARSVNSQRSWGGEGDDSSAPARLERLLREAKRSHCEAFASSEVPVECR